MGLLLTSARNRATALMIKTKVTLTFRDGPVPVRMRGFWGASLSKNTLADYK